jgi:ankyrin repeat protein
MTMSGDDRRGAGRELLIHEAFCRGDLDVLRALVDDAASIPNGPLPAAFGTCLVYAIYHSPLAFVRTLLQMGADPDAPADDGFPPLIAAIVSGREYPSTHARDDLPDLLRLLLAFGADPNQRGHNDYTALHTAVAERNADAVRILLAAGADPGLRTRIDDCETPLEMARAVGLAEITAIFEAHDQARQTSPRIGRP